MKVIHFYGLARHLTEEDVEQLFQEYHTPLPTKIKWVEGKNREGGQDDRAGAGLAYFETRLVASFSVCIG